MRGGGRDGEEEEIGRKRRDGRRVDGIVMARKAGS